jgi:hypothetical protein
MHVAALFFKISLHFLALCAGTFGCDPQWALGISFSPYTSQWHFVLDRIRSKLPPWPLNPGSVVPESVLVAPPQGLCTALSSAWEALPNLMQGCSLPVFFGSQTFDPSLPPIAFTYHIDLLYVFFKALALCQCFLLCGL